MLGHNADPAVRAAWLDDMFPPPDVLEWALNVVVVRSGGRTILIDAGMGAEFPESFDAEEFLAGGARRDRTTDLVKHNHKLMGNWPCAYERRMREAHQHALPAQCA
jgi:hypothetical protein